MSNVQLDFIYDLIEGLLVSNNSQILDRVLFLNLVNIQHFDTDLILAILTITLPAKYLLTNREGFFNLAEIELKTRKNWTPRVLSRLE